MKKYEQAKIEILQFAADVILVSDGSNAYFDDVWGSDGWNGGAI